MSEVDKINEQIAQLTAQRESVIVMKLQTSTSQVLFISNQLDEVSR